MSNLGKAATFISLMMFALNAPAEMNKCTDSNGKVTYTNLACPPGYEVTNSIGDNSTAVEGNPSFTQQELDQMLAPIALYPDPLLSQILMAATYPLEVVEAARWSNANPNLTGDAAVQAVNSQNWDPSIKSLVAFPQVLQTMDQNIEWTERLGDAFLGQQSQVMDTVQRLRQKAQQARQSEVQPASAGYPIGWRHRCHRCKSRRGICALLRPQCGLWTLVVAGLSACVLGTMG